MEPKSQTNINPESIGILSITSMKNFIAFDTVEPLVRNLWNRLVI